MANFYLDNPSLKHHLHHPLMERIVELKERGFADKDKYDYAPQDFEDAMDSYEKVLEIVGEIWDETDDPDNPVSEKSDGSYIIDGGMNLEDFFDLFNINDEEIDTEYVTVGGFIIELLDDRFASVGDEIHYKDLTMKVIALGKHKTVKKLLVKQDKSEDEQKDKKDN